MLLSIFRIEKTKGYTVMSNHHLRNPVLSLKAKGLLSQMLSLPEDWDYTLKGLSHINRESVDAIRTAIWELEQAGYVLRKQGRDSKGKMTAIEYIIYEQPTYTEPQKEHEKATYPIPENPTSAKPIPENPIQINKDIQNKDLQITDKNLIPSYRFPKEGKDEKGSDSRIDYSIYEQLIKKNIEYDILSTDKDIPHDELDEIVSIMLDTVCTSRKTIQISGDNYPAEVVKSRFLKLNSTHIQYIFSCLHENTTKVRNIKKYLMAVLYNAPVTMENYYSALYSHDMAR